MVPSPSPGPGAGLSLNKCQLHACVLEAKGIFKTNQALPSCIYVRKLKPREVALHAPGHTGRWCWVTGTHTAPSTAEEPAPSSPAAVTPRGADLLCSLSLTH